MLPAANRDCGTPRFDQCGAVWEKNWLICSALFDDFTGVFGLGGERREEGGVLNNYLKLCRLCRGNCRLVY